MLIPLYSLLVETMHNEYKYKNDASIMYKFIIYSCFIYKKENEMSKLLNVWMKYAWTWLTWIHKFYNMKWDEQCFTGEEPLDMVSQFSEKYTWAENFKV